jgi:hypothetical protein
MIARLSRTRRTLQIFRTDHLDSKSLWIRCSYSGRLRPRRARSHDDCQSRYLSACCAGRFQKCRILQLHSIVSGMFDSLLEKLNFRPGRRLSPSGTGSLAVRQPRYRSYPASSELPERQLIRVPQGPGPPCSPSLTSEIPKRMRPSGARRSPIQD